MPSALRLSPVECKNGNMSIKMKNMSKISKRLERQKEVKREKYKEVEKMFWIE